MNRERNWVDDDDDEDYETAADANGIKEKVKTVTDNRGQKIRTVQRVKVQEIKRRTPKGILERKNLPKFGEAVKETDYRDCVSKEVGIMEYPGDDEAEPEIDLSRPTLSSLSALSLRQENRERDAKDAENDDEPADKIEFKPRPVDAMDTTIRVSNLSKSVSEVELRDLFSPYGSISKVSLPRTVNQITGLKEVRGFAYITYDSRHAAESAMAAIDGRGYDHLILKLEWAKPPKDGGGSGLSSGYMSGYGKQLAQDTKEKNVTFTSHASNNW